MQIIFEDRDVLVIDKPCGIAVIPERDVKVASLVKELEKAGKGRLFVVHRLDKEVSGVLVFAKNAAVHRSLNMQFEKRKVKKAYLALVDGLPELEKGRVDAPVRAFGSGRMGVDIKKGKESLSLWERLSSGEGRSLLRLCPVTGRRHQLRVHMYYMGHPILGDLRYGDKEKQKNWPRLMLHSSFLSFQLEDGRELNFTSPMPEIFKAYL